MSMLISFLVPGIPYRKSLGGRGRLVLTLDPYWFLVGIGKEVRAIW